MSKSSTMGQGRVDTAQDDNKFGGSNKDAQKVDLNEIQMEKASRTPKSPKDRSNFNALKDKTVVDKPIFFAMGGREKEEWRKARYNVGKLFADYIAKKHKIHGNWKVLKNACSYVEHDDFL